MTNTSKKAGGAHALLRGLIELTWWLWLTVVPLALVAAPLSGTIQTLIPVGVHIEPDLYEFEPLRDGGPVPRLGDVTGTLSLDRAFISLWFWLSMVVAYAVALYVLKLVRDIVRSLGKRPFEPANAGRIERIGWILLAWGVLSPFGSPIAEAMVGADLASRGVQVSFPMTFDGNALIYPLLVLVLARVFRHGAELQAEQDLTV